MYLWMSFNEWFQPQTSMEQDLSRRAHRHLAKVTSFYLRSLAKHVEHWLLFECCFAFLVLLTGFMTSEETFKSCSLLPHLNVHEELSSRTTLFQVGGDDTARPSVFTATCASTPTRHAKVNLLLYACLQLRLWNGMLLHTPSFVHDRDASTSTEGREAAMKARGLKADVTEAWKRRRKKGAGHSGAPTGAAGPAAGPLRRTDRRAGLHAEMAFGILGRHTPELADSYAGPTGSQPGLPVSSPDQPAPSPAPPVSLPEGNVCVIQPLACIPTYPLDYK